MTKNGNGKATTLKNIGLVYLDLEEKQKALSYYNTALPLLRAVGNKGMEGGECSNGTENRVKLKTLTIQRFY